MVACGFMSVCVLRSIYRDFWDGGVSLIVRPDLPSTVTVRAPTSISVIVQPGAT